MAKFLLVFLLVLAAAVGLYTYRSSAAPFGYDESDYVYASGFPALAHWTDAQAMPIVDYVRIGLGRGLDQKQRLALSRFSRAVDDPDVYRHWHGPVYWYWLGLLAHFTHDERVLRWWGLFFPALSALLIAHASIRILPPDSGPIAALIASCLIMWSPVSLFSSEVAPHLTFVFCSLAALVFLAKVMLQGKRSDWYWAVAATGVAFCTMEITFVLVATMMICGWRRRSELAVDFKFVLKSLGVFAATVLVLWPAAILRLSAAKAYMFMVYLAAFRKAPWGDIGFLGTWRLRFLLAPVEWLLILIGVALLIRNRRTVEARAVEPFVWFGGLMVLALARVSTDVPRYATPFMAALDVIAAWMIACHLARLRPTLRMASTAAIVALAGISSWLAVRQHRPNDDPNSWFALKRVRDQGDAPVVVPQSFMPQLHYYAPAAKLQPFLISWEEAFPIDSETPVMVVTNDKKVFSVKCPRCKEKVTLDGSATAPVSVSQLDTLRPAGFLR